MIAHVGCRLTGSSGLGRGLGDLGLFLGGLLDRVSRGSCFLSASHPVDLTMLDGPAGTSTPAALASASGAISAAFTSAATASAALTSSALGSSVFVSTATGSSALASAGLASSGFASVAGAAGVDSGLAASAGLSSVLVASAAGAVSAGFCSALLSFFLKMALSLALRLSRAPGADVC